MNLCIKLPVDVLEFLFYTLGSIPDTASKFGLPILSGAAHPSAAGWTQIELDFEPAVDYMAASYKFWLCADTASPQFGAVVLDAAKGRRQFKNVAASFQEFLDAFVEMMMDFQIARGNSDEQAEVIEDFYYNYTLLRKVKRVGIGNMGQEGEHFDCKYMRID
jgi:hypothetical protein